MWGGVDELLNQVADHAAPPDAEHQRSCRHCHATLAEITALWHPCTTLPPSPWAVATCPPTSATPHATGHRAETATAVPVSGTPVVIDVQIVVEQGAHIPAVASQVRTQITRHVTAQTGLTAAAANIYIVDVRPRL